MLRDAAHRRDVVPEPVIHQSLFGHEEEQIDENEQGQGLDIAVPPAGHKFSSEPSRSRDEWEQAAEDLGIEMREVMDRVLREVSQRKILRGEPLLTTGRTIGAGTGDGTGGAMYRRRRVHVRYRLRGTLTH